MTSNPCGLFCQGQGMGEGEMNTFINHCIAANYATVCIMDNYGLCQRLKDRLPDCDVAFRASTFQPSPAADNKAVIRDYFKKLPPDKRIRQSINCENGFSPERVKMAVDQITAAEEDGWKLVVCNVGPGTVRSGQLKGDGTHEPNEWLTIGEPLLRKLAECPNQAVGYHDYTSVFAWIVTNGTYLFQTHDKPPVVDWTLAQWHIGRNLQGILAACDQLSIAVPMMLVTEVFIDQMNDIQNNPANPYHGIDSRGWRNLIDEWERQYYKGTSAEDTLANQFQWIWENIYAKFGRGKVKGLNFFTWLSSSLANGQWKSDNVANAPQFQRRMEAYRPTATVPPDPQPPQPPAKPPNAAQPVTFTVTADYNLRVEPNKTAASIGLLKAGEQVTAYRQPETVNDNVWHFAERAAPTAGEAAQGYSAVPLPAIEPPPNQDGLFLTEAEEARVLQLLEQIETQESILAGARTTIENAEKAIASAREQILVIMEDANERDNRQTRIPIAS